MNVDRLLRLTLGLCLLYGAYEIADAAFDEIGSVLGELFAESVISAGNETEGTDHAT